MAGPPGYWQTRLARLLEQKEPVRLHVATAYARLGKHQQAIEWLERAAVETPADFGLVRLIFAPAWKQMHEDSRFKDLIRKVGLEQ